MVQPLTIFSFFSGAGFLDLGFELSGYKIAFANELLEPFMQSYQYSRRLFQLPPLEYGYETCSVKDFLEPSNAIRLQSLVQDARRSSPLVGFIGGPPCPDFSVGGKNRGRKGDQGKLSATFIEIICQQQPDFFLFENVKGLWRTKKHREFYEDLKRKLREAGYVLTEKLINAIEYGVPQDRERIILIGFLGDLSSRNYSDASEGLLLFPWNKYTQYPKEVVCQEFWPSINEFQENSILPCPQDIPKELTVEHWFNRNDVLNHQNAQHRFKPKAGRQRFSSVQEGDTSRKSYKRLHRWRFSPTACYGNNEVHLHPYKIRRISVAEALALQSLPRKYAFPENMTLTNMFKMIGNGVPYLASRGIAKSILYFLDELAVGKQVLEVDASYKQMELKLKIG